MSTRLVLLATALAVFSVSSAGKATTLVNFDNFVGMTNASGSTVPLASRLSTQLLASAGISFSSGSGFVAVIDHRPGSPSSTPTPPNIIGGTTALGALSYSTPIQASFFTLADPTVKATTNFVRVLGDWRPLGFGTITLEGYDILGSLIGSTSQPDVGPIGTGADLTLAIAGIHSARFYSNNGTVGFDNFEFGALSQSTANVPEPASWAMLIAGFGIVGAAARRQRAVRFVPA